MFFISANERGDHIVRLGLLRKLYIELAKMFVANTHIINRPFQMPCVQPLSCWTTQQHKYISCMPSWVHVFRNPAELIKAWYEARELGLSTLLVEKQAAEAAHYRAWIANNWDGGDTQSQELETRLRREAYGIHNRVSLIYAWLSTNYETT